MRNAPPTPADEIDSQKSVTERAAAAVEPFRAHPHDGDQLTAHADGTTDDTRVGAELRAPRAVAHDGVVAGAHVVEGRLEPPAHARFDAKHREIAGRDVLDQSLSRTVLRLPGNRGRRRGGDTREHIGVGGHVACRRERAGAGVTGVRVW